MIRCARPGAQEALMVGSWGGGGQRSGLLHSMIRWVTSVFDIADEQLWTKIMIDSLCGQAGRGCIPQQTVRMHHLEVSGA